MNCQGQTVFVRTDPGGADAAAWKWRFWIYAFYLGLLTLAPYQPSLRTLELLQRSNPLDVVLDLIYLSPLDILNNIVLFLPFGFLLPMAYPARFGGNSANHLVRTAAAGLVVSACIEIAQLFLPGRSTTINDLAMNGFGTLMGFRLASVWCSSHRPNPVLSAGRKRKTAGVLAVLYGLVLSGLCAWPAMRNGFQTWEPELPLLVGNEATGDRPWNGEIREIVLSEGVPAGCGWKAGIPAWEGAAGGHVPLLHFRFQEGRGDTVYSRITGGAPFRLAAAGLEWSEGGSGIRVNGETPLRNMDSTDFVFEPVRRASAMVLTVRLRTGNPEQSGPARIVTLSRNTLERNFTLAQDGPDLVFRVRTEQAGPNGSRKAASAPDVFRDNGWHRVDAVFKRGYSGLYVDGRPAGRCLRVPDDYLPDSLGMGGGRLTVVLFWLAALMPFGFLGSWIFPSRWRWPAGIAAALLFFFLIRSAAWCFLHQPFGF
ncbi:VanZ family protein [bacterium]|nr:VanZ family protein [bacterium]